MKITLIENKELSEKESEQLKEDMETLSNTDSKVFRFWAKILTKSNHIKDKSRKENNMMVIER